MLKAVSHQDSISKDKDSTQPCQSTCDDEARPPTVKKFLFLTGVAGISPCALCVLLGIIKKNLALSS